MTSGHWQKRTDRKFQDSFLEALREMGTKDLPDLPDFTLNSTPQKQKSGTLRAGETASVGEQSLETQRYKRLFFQERNLRSQERSLSVRRDQEVKLKVQELHQELARYSQSHVQFEEQVKVTVLQPLTPDVGTYHVSFLEHLISLVLLLRKNVESASNWLAVFNQRNKKKGYYWGNVKKSGSKFYLSPDRNPANQAG